MHVEIATEPQAIFEKNVLDHEVVVDWIRLQTQRLIATQKDFHLFHLHMRDLERALLRDHTHAEFFSNIISKLESDELLLLNNLYCLWETLLEKRFVQFLDNEVVKHYLDYPLYARFERLIEREIGLLNGYKPKRLLFIGSGPMPITALCLQHRLGTQIDCLERYPEAVNESRLVMKKLRMEGAINVFQGRGENHNMSEYDVILVALLAKPKKAILQNILKHCNDDVRIICRTSDNSRHVFYEPTLENAIPAPLVVKAFAPADVDDTISSVLLRKELQS